MSLVTAHAAHSSLGQDDPPLLVADEHGAGAGNIGEDRATDHVMDTVESINSHHVTLGVEVKSATHSHMSCVVGLHEALVEHFRPDGWIYLGEHCGHQDCSYQYSDHFHYKS